MTLISSSPTKVTAVEPPGEMMSMSGCRTGMDRPSVSRISNGRNGLWARRSRSALVIIGTSLPGRLLLVDRHQHRIDGLVLLLAGEDLVDQVPGLGLGVADREQGVVSVPDHVRLGVRGLAVALL